MAMFRWLASRKSRSFASVCGAPIAHAPKRQPSSLRHIMPSILLEDLNRHKAACKGGVDHRQIALRK